MGWGSPLTGGVALDDQTFNNINPENEVAKHPWSWSARHEGTNTIIHANFDGANPNERLAEIYVRELLFFPRANGLRYITLDGLTFLHAANGWVEYHGFQKGAVGTRYGYGWIIQNCHIADCRTVGISSGEYRPKRENLVPEKNEDIEAVGHHIFRNNLVERCGQAGFIGAYGYAASIIEGNLIQDIGIPHWTENPEAYFGGWESGGIKIHFAVDVTIKNNIIRRVHIYGSPKTPVMSAPGIWIDCGGQGVRITGNIIYEISNDFAIYLEVDHGPLLVDNNVLIDKTIGSKSSRIVLAHNLFVNSGLTYAGTDGRGMPVWVPHTLNVAQGTWCRYVGDRYYNNIYIGGGERGLPRDQPEPPDYRAGNSVFYLGGKPSRWDTNSVVDAAFDPRFTKSDLPDGVTLTFSVNDAPLAVKCPLITYDFIGKWSMVNQGIEDHEGKGITITEDLLGKPRNKTSPAAGPFEPLAVGKPNTFTLTAGPRRPETSGQKTSHQQ